MSSTTKSTGENVPLAAYRQQMDRFFARYPNVVLEKRAIKALRILAAVDKSLAGQPQAWTAGVIYAVANLDRQPCGVPGPLNSEFVEFFGVSMESIRRRASHIVNQISI